MKKYLAVFFLVIIVAVAGCIWYQKTYPTILVATHNMGRDGFISNVLIKNPPLTDKGKINWWKQNADKFREKYNVPDSNVKGFFYIKIWDFADGYKELEKYDRLCFDDMKTKKNCIDKNWVMTIENTRGGGMQYDIGEVSYVEGENGKLIKQED
ncbi:DUF943 family protein [Paramixta manurensis]|uniref:DUF943 family protein n=1 Tax=Paramixta manurensis TaxID=2740817 RepID=A0A6M8UFX6_9GAMM|nr:DUF943 family protein [Erwiniaceae bacterium PD-1]